MGVKYVEIEKIDNYIENPRHEVGLNELDTLKSYLMFLDIKI